MAAALALRGKRPATCATYLWCVRRYCEHHGGADPASLGADELEAFFLHLMRERG